MDWIHCNSCFSQPMGNGDMKQYYLTSCGHIFCKNCGCFVDGTSNCCKQCKVTCSSTVIGEKSFRTNPQVSKYFQESEEVCENLLKVVLFQKSHRNKLIGHHQHILSRYNKAKLYIKKLENELKMTKNTLWNIQQNPKNIIQAEPVVSTPIFYPNSTPFKMIDAESRFRMEVPDNMRHRNQSFRNELSTLSTESMRSGVPTPSSSIYASPLQESCNEKNIPKIDNLHLNSYGQPRIFKR